MATLYVGEKHAYRDEVSAARAESAHIAVHAARAHTLDWDAKLVFRVDFEDGRRHFTTDDIEVRKLVEKHPDCHVHVITVA
ncbi:MAG: hypothetical protein R8L07_01590 [Alphaproteobacteria bacterium]|nr:hypothetical protein [Alphaproteobacteria bacterium]